MSGEFGLAGGGEEHVEDWLECFRTECPCWAVQGENNPLWLRGQRY